MLVNRSKFNYLIPLLVFSSTIKAQAPLAIEWKMVARLPDDAKYGAHSGLAGAFSGYTKNAVLIAGGANFPKGLPWEGGQKVYHDRIYVLLKDATGSFRWHPQSFLLDKPIAYGATVMTEEGILCIGGENMHALSDEVFQLVWDEKSLEVTKQYLPPLPFPLTNLSATIIGRKIYVAGGETAKEVSNQLFSLDLDNLSVGWVTLRSIPTPMANSVLVTQYLNGVLHLFMIGGRTKRPGALTDFHSTVFAYDPLHDQWHSRTALPFELAAGSAIPVGDRTILYLGGDKGDVYRKVEELLLEAAASSNGYQKERLVGQKNQLQINHPGFNQSVLTYDTENNRWSMGRQLPFSAPATTNIFIMGSLLLVPSGEVRPGIRSPVIWGGILKNE